MKNKNIHILLTDKLSRLYYFTANKAGYYLYSNNELVIPINPNCQNQNIYITSNEEIKDRDYIFIHGHYKYKKHVTKVNKITDTYEVIEGGNHSKKACQKIILTTDTKLIQDGVQAIDNDFLEWFVNNPSCESVDIESKKFTYNKEYWYTHYTIIIPKEEPKYSIKKEYVDEQDAYGYDVLVKEKPKREFVNNISKWNKKDFEEHKQETIEEVKHKGKVLTEQEVMENRSSKYEFIDFGKLAEQACLSRLDDTLSVEFTDGFKIGAKFAQKELYTKKDMLEAFNAGNKRGHSGYPNTDNWTQPTFEDFILRKKETKKL